MDTTRASLLIRIKDVRDTRAWSEFYDLYGPLLYRYARARGLNHDDADDIRSACYEAIVRQIPYFDYDKEKGGFKAWLRTIVSRRVIDLLRRRREVAAQASELDQRAGGSPSADQLWEENWRQQHLKYCVRQVRGQFADKTYQAFCLLMQDDLSVAEVCQRLDLTPNQVYKAKARVLSAVRTMMQVLDPDAAV